MTKHATQPLGLLLANYLRGFKRYFLRDKSFGHFHTYCRGLLSDLERKSVEPIALAAGVPARTLQVFLNQGAWDHLRHRDGLQQRVAHAFASIPDDGLGTIGILDETSAVKKGDQTPGVQRQYCGAVGKIENCIVTVHLGVARGRCRTIVDADLFLPEGWDADRSRCRDAGIPDEVTYLPKWMIGLQQLARTRRHGLKVDWLVFDEGYGRIPEFLGLLDLMRQNFIGEVPKHFSCRVNHAKRSRRADWLLNSSSARHQPWRRFRLNHETDASQTWEAKVIPVRVGGCGPVPLRMIVTRQVVTGEIKYWISNAGGHVGLERLLRIAFSRWKVEHCFRVMKTEMGLTHYEGRNYTGLMRHQIGCLTVMVFTSLHTERRGEKKSRGDDGASVPSVESPMLDATGSSAWHESEAPCGSGGGLSPTPQPDRPPLQAAS